MKHLPFTHLASLPSQGSVSKRLPPRAWLAAGVVCLGLTVTPAVKGLFR